MKLFWLETIQIEELLEKETPYPISSYTSFFRY